MRSINDCRQFKALMTTRDLSCRGVLVGRTLCCCLISYVCRGENYRCRQLLSLYDWKTGCGIFLIFHSGEFYSRILRHCYRMQPPFVHLWSAWRLTMQAQVFRPLLESSLAVLFSVPQLPTC